MGLSRRPCFRHLCRNPDDRSLISRSERKIPSIVAAVTIEQCWHRVPGGTAVAACRVLDAMAEFPDVRSIGLASWHRRPIPAAFDPGIPVRHAPIPGPLLYDAWAQLHAPRAEWIVRGADLVHATTVLVPPTRKPLVVTLHDLAFLHDPSMFTPRGVRLFERSLAAIRRRADLVLCSSSATMQDCTDAGIAADRLRLVILGADPVVSVDEAVRAEVLARHGISRPYVLFVGTQEPRKNLAGLLQAFARLEDKHLDLVVIGPIGWGADLKVPDAIKDRVHAVGFVHQRDLAALYAGAAVFAYPSFREGFGLPVAEAMAYGIPVVTARGTSTEEVAGGAAVLIDPHDPDDIARGISEAIRDTNRLAERGRARAATLTWAETARRTRDAYLEVVR